jgi:hypothetical protein
MEKHYEYKKGDLVKHIPSGCVGKVARDYLGMMYVDVKVPNVHQQFQWAVKDCRPYVDPAHVVEADDFQ